MRKIRRIFSVLLIICFFIQIPLYAGAEIQLSEQNVEKELEYMSEIIDVSKYKNTYISSDDLGIQTFSGSNVKTINENLNLPAKYDSREKGYITSVKNQSPYGTCWAHGVIAASESSIIKHGLYKGEKELDLSEMYLAYSFYHRKNDPLKNTEGDKNTILEKNWLDFGGNGHSTSFFLAQWSNPLLEEEVPYSKIPTENQEYGLPDYKLENAIFVYEQDIEAIKSYIMEYGAVHAVYHTNFSEFTKNIPYYEPDTEFQSHAMAIVGWDDTVSKESFSNPKPDRDGAWIVKNSWGERGKNKGFFYMSQAQPISDVIAFDYMKSDEYDFNYFYDGSCASISSVWDQGSVTAGNIYEAKKGTGLYKEYIKGISVNVATSSVNGEVQIYKDIKNSSDPTSGTPMLKTPLKFYKEFEGVYTIPLNQLIQIEKGTKFSVVVTLRNSTEYRCSIYASEQHNGIDVLTQEHTDPNQSFIYKNNKWNDLHGFEGRYRSAAIKALTVIDDTRTPINKEDITLEKTEYDYSGNECKPKATIVVNGKKLKESEDYEINYSDNINAGTAVATISALNNYRGEIKIPFNINRAVLMEDMVGKLGSYKYTGSYMLPEITIKYGEHILTVNKDYTASYKQNLNVGTAIVTITGLGNYTGTIKRTFEILPCELKNSMVQDIEFQTYTGESIKPNVIVKDGQRTLVSGIDYDVSYGENVNVGTGTVQISGKGNYTGNVTKSFQIVEVTQKYYNITASAQLGGSITPSGEIKVLEGESQTFNISAYDGYLIDDVKVDGESVGAVSEYVFTFVDGEHTIEATFKTPVKVDSIKLSDNEITLKEGESYTLTAEVNPEQAEDKSLLWETGNKDIATVDNGVITALTAGSTVITVKSHDGSEVSASCAVTVTASNSGEDSSNTSNSTQSNTSLTQNSTSVSPTTAARTHVNNKLSQTVNPTNNKNTNPSTNKVTVPKPAKVKAVKLTAKKKKLNVKWKKVSGATGYEVMYAKNNKFTKGKKTVKVKKNKITLKRLKSKKKYFVKVRAYKTINGNTSYGKWSKVVKKKAK